MGSEGRISRVLKRGTRLSNSRRQPSSSVIGCALILSSEGKLVLRVSPLIAMTSLGPLSGRVNKVYRVAKAVYIAKGGKMFRCVWLIGLERYIVRLVISS